MSGPIFGAIDVALPPHELARADLSTYGLPQYGELDLGVPGYDVPQYVAPPHELDAGRVPTLAPYVHQPSIVPGLDWMLGGPTRPVGPHGRPEPSVQVQPVMPPPPDPGDISELTVGDHVLGGAKGFLLPAIVGGAFSGAIAAAALRGTGGSGAAFATRFLGNSALGIATGAAAGLLVAASAPKEGDSLAARYAVAGGAIGAATGAMFPGGPSRALAATFSAASGAIIAAFVGAGVQRAAEGR